ncbi:MAG: fluoride efflux transporter CrcB [Planctomycetota bacterium]
MRDLLLVGAGGFLGATLRYGVSLAFAGSSFPYGTLLVNIVGSLAIGLLAGWIATGVVQDVHREFFAIGLLGALTTFATFSYETVALVQRGDMGLAGLSVLLNVVLSIGAAFLGLRLVS